MRMQQNGILGGIPAPRGPKSPQQVAAEQIVESDVPKELEALIKERKALELLASAQRDKQAQQLVPPQTVKSQVEGGLASMMDRLRPGMAQRGRQVQVARNRQAMGLPSMPAPNMARRMANGGVVGYAEGGPPQEDTSMLDKIKAGLGGLFGGEEEATQQPFDVEGRVIELIKARETADEEARARIDQALSTFDPDTRAKARQRMSDMQAGGVVGFQDRGFVDVDEIAEEYNLTPEGVDRLLDLSELSEERQEVEVEAPRERPRYRTPEERRAGPQLGDSLVEFVKENPLQAASIASLAIPGLGIAGAGLRGLGALGTRFGPSMARALAPLVSRPRMSGYGSAIRNPKTGRMMSAKDAQAAGLRLNRQASIPRIAGTAGITGLLADQAMRGGGDEVSAEEVTVAPAPREPTPQEKLGSMVGRPTAMFKAGEPETTRRGLGRDVDIDELVAFLTSARGTDFASTVGAGAKGARAYREAERKRQDELDALKESQKIQREQIAATLGAAEIRSAAAIQQAIAKLMSEYPTTSGYQVALASKAEELGLDRNDPAVREAVLKDYGNYVMKSFQQNSGGVENALGFSPEDLALIEQYAPQRTE